MGTLETKIRRAVSEGRWAFTVHVEARLAEREIESWQVVAGLDEGETLRELKA
jgi:hypothetical protein